MLIEASSCPTSMVYWPVTWRLEGRYSPPTGTDFVTSERNKTHGLNRLIHEISPYLRQHASNPVDWYPWGLEALERARAEDKPIFLSIGYSACHWCHVMARESFEDPKTAELMNRLFVNIKVDREERPDLDAIYMTAVQAMTGQGGWPLSVWLTPDGSPFYGGTYFPLHDRHGLPSFRRVLVAVAEAYRERRGQVKESAAQLRSALQRTSLVNSAEGSLDPTIADQAFQGLLRSYDRREGGFGLAPKFPPPMLLGFLLRYHYRTNNGQALQMVVHTLRRMARGGMYDQLGGGFHRYSVDRYWLVPHFEKMLYDNAQLARSYLEAWLVTGETEFRRVAEETLDYLVRDMTDPAGGFYSAQDADSEGEEGKFFVWKMEELVEILGADDARLVAAYYGVTEHGHFEGKNILHVPADLSTVARRMGVPAHQLRAVLDRARPRLLQVRQSRVKPGRDDKVLTSWNGLTLRAFAFAAAALSRDDYRLVAERNAEFLWRKLRTAEGRLLRVWAPASLTGDEPRARYNAYLEDYANLIDGLLALYQLNFDVRWLEFSRELADAMIEQFWDEEAGCFYQTSHDHEPLVARLKDVVDNAVPAGNSVAADIIGQLAVLTDGRTRASGRSYASYAEAILLLLREAMARQPLAFGHLLSALERRLVRPLEVAVVGPPADPRVQALLAEVRQRFLPQAVVVLAPSDEAARALAATIPLLAGRSQLGGQPTAYVCQNFACQLPVTDRQGLAAQLKALAKNSK